MLFKKNTIIYTLFLMLFVSFHSLAQDIDINEDVEQSTQKNKNNNANLPPYNDSVYRFFTQKQIPKKAALYSAVLPGLGQVYNKQYWKLGLVAIAGAGVTGFMIFNTQKYNTYQKAYIGRIDNDPSTTDTFTNYTLDDIDLLRKTYRKYREYTVIAGTLCYLVNILDAFTSAHMKSFDMSKNISFKALPVLIPGQYAGIKIIYQFNNTYYENSIDRLR